MQVVRTPESCFNHLKDYPFAPNYMNIASNLRMHYVDEGNKTADPVLMLHGEPSWSYLYRHMIPVCVAAGHRVIAPDLIGFGKSDKPTKVKDYSFQAHVDWIITLIEKLNLTNITLVGQDWGSLIGLRLAAEYPHRFARIVIANGMLPSGDFSIIKEASFIAPVAFLAWRTFALYSPLFPVGKIVNIGANFKLDHAEQAAYNAPFPSRQYMAGARAFPKLVPITPLDPAAPNVHAAWEVLAKWEKPFLTCFSDKDPITRGMEKYLQKRIPGAIGQPHITLAGGHFVQENSPNEFANAINQLIAATPLEQ